MKKLLGIVVLGLLLSGNAYAATKFTYLSCKKIIKKNNSKAKQFSVNNDYLKIGANNGYYFYKFKDDEKKSKVRIYEQGVSVDRDWRKKNQKNTQKVVLNGMHLIRVITYILL